MRKAISFLLIVPLFLGFLAVPAEAVEIDNNDLLNVLEYSFLDYGVDNMLSGTASGTYNFYYVLPQQMTFSYLDMVISVNSGALNSVDCLQFDGGTLMAIGNGYYRYYATTEAPTSDYFLDFEVDMTGPFEIEIVSLYVGVSYFDYMEDKVKFSVMFGSDYLEATWLPGDDPYTISFAGTGYDDSFIATLYPLNWERYDYFDLVFYMNVSEINSISCEVDGVAVPFDVQYLQTGSTYGDYQRIVVRMDFRGLDRTGADPMLQIDGLCLDGSANSIMMVSGTGIVATNTVDADTFWLKELVIACWDFFAEIVEKLEVWFGNLTASIAYQFESLRNWLRTEFDEIIAAINPETDADEKVAEDVGQKTDELDEVGAALEGVEKPVVDDMDFGVGSMVSSGDVTSYTSGLAWIIGSDIIGSVFMMAFTLAFVAYILYGKR